MIFLLKYSMFCYNDKQLLSVLGFVHYELDTNKKRQISLVVKYISKTFLALPLAQVSRRAFVRGKRMGK